MDFRSHLSIWQLYEPSSTDRVTDVFAYWLLLSSWDLKQDQCGVNAWLGPPGPASGHSAPHPRFASAQTPLTGRTSHKHLLDDPELIPCMPCVHSTDKQTEALTGSMMWGRGPCSSNPEPTLDLVGLTPDTKDPEQ
ncbi:hypothetical protein MG293_008407 [Ovis ammon polii]|uniref:Uncharacterized protein n=1 Tax=Ovis ammon polii TaxID=230172 RepID=A0AAD4UCZ7_OVIAM|nr:hypothetical protein MG293_008407 [Ovis ammon polii]